MASGALNPIDNPQFWDTITIAQAVSPGVCKVSDFKRAHEWDIKKGKGTIGGTVTFVGRPPAKGSITFYLWTPLHFEQWETFRKQLKYDPTKQAVTAVDIFYPSLADVDIKSVVTESIGSIVHEGKQLYSIVVEFLEYFPPPKKSAVSTPDGSKSIDEKSRFATSGGPPDPPGESPDAIGAAKDREIAAHLKKAGLT